MVVKSAIFAPLTSIRSLAFPSITSMVRSKVGMDCLCVSLNVTIFRVSWRTGLNLSLLIASTEMKFLPDPVSKYAHSVFPSILTGMIAGSVSSVDGVYTVSRGFPFLSQMLVWCFPLHLKQPRLRHCWLMCPFLHNCNTIGYPLKTSFCSLVSCTFRNVLPGGFVCSRGRRVLFSFDMIAVYPLLLQHTGVSLSFGFLERIQAVLPFCSSSAISVGCL